MKKRELINNGLWTLIALFFLGISELIFNSLIAKKFGPEKLASANIALYSAILISNILITIFSPTIKKFTSEFLGKKDYNLSNSIAKYILKLTSNFSILILILLIVFRNHIKKIFSIESEYYVFFLMIFTLYTFYQILKSVSYGRNNVKNYAISEIVSRLIFFMTLIISLITEKFILLAFVLSYVTFSIFQLFFEKELFNSRKKISLNLKKKMLKFGLLCFIGTFAVIARNRLSIIIPIQFISKELIGIYSAVISIQTIFYFLPKALNLVSGPYFSYFHGKKDEFIITKSVNAMTKYLGYFTFIIVGSFFLLTPHIIKLLFGNEFLVGDLTLKIILISISINIINIPTIQALVNTKYAAIPNISGILNLIINVIGWFILIPKFGINGIAFSHLIGNLINALIPAVYAKNKMNIDLLKPTIMSIKFTILLIIGYYFRTKIITSIIFIFVFILLNYKITKELITKTKLYFKNE